MGMSNAERQRKFRMNRDQDPVKRQLYLNAEKKRYQQDRKSGKKKTINDMTEREKRQQRRKWKKRKTEQRKKSKEAAAAEVSQLLSPPLSPEMPGPSHQEVSSRKKKKRVQAKCFRQNASLKKQLENEKKKTQMYKQRWLREQQSKQTKLGLDTPRTKTRKMLRHLSDKSVRKTLDFHNALIDQIRHSYKSCSKDKDKRNIARTLSGNILRKYGFKCVAFSACGINIRDKNKKRIPLSARMLKDVRVFYDRDDVSRIIPGLKRTVTSKKVKKQRRILCDSLKNLYAKFLTETNKELSYSLFCRLRPFWVVFPNNSDRSTCLCKMCENSQFMATALKKAKALDTDNLDTLLIETVCDSGSKECMYSTCRHCSKKRVSFRTQHDVFTEWSQWQTKTEKRMFKVSKTMQEKDVTFTLKDTMEGRVDQLKDDFENQLIRFKRHTFNIRNQYQYFRERKMNLKKDEVLIHIDFSENYSCKLGQEIQGMHFGASKRQLSLHTGVIYTRSCKHQTFCTISENLHHGPGGVWGHMKPILQNIRDMHPDINKVEIFSDGPAAQYKQKGNFYLLSTEPYKLGFSEVVWNFLESGHGKGVPDAVGGSVKRCADQAVKFGKDIFCAEDFADALKNSATDVYVIPDEHITREHNHLDDIQLKSIAGTMKIHQVFSTTCGAISYRDLSCTCQPNNTCEGHQLSHAILLQNSSQQKVSKVKGKVKNQPKSNGNHRKNEGSNVVGTKKEIKVKAGNMQKEKTVVKAVPETKEGGSDIHRENTVVDMYSNYIEELKKCKTITSLREKCESLSKTICSISTPQQVSFTTHGLEVDHGAIDNLPSDLDCNTALFPCKVLADGNCLPSCGSLFAFGSIHKALELRVRIVVELVLNEAYYLNNDDLQRGLKEKTKHHIPKIYAQYSDMFVPGMYLTDKLVQDIFRLETLKVRQNKTFMGIWQLHGLASVLNTPLFSVYPSLGNPNVRNDLHRLIMPRPQEKSPVFSSPMYIMWTSTRVDMNRSNWIPNHFVPVVPVSVKTPQDVEIESKNEADETLKNNIGLEGEGQQDTRVQADETRGEDMEQDETQKDTRVQADETRGEDMEQDETQKDTRVQAEETRGEDMEQDETQKETNNIGGYSMSTVMIKDGEYKPQKAQDDEIRFDIPEPGKLVGKYVIVKYDNLPYPGVVIDAGVDDLLVECMHKTSKKFANCFYWPKKLLDRCWYDHSNVIAIIPKPTQIPGSSQFEVDSETWSFAVQHVN